MKIMKQKYLLMVLAVVLVGGLAYAGTSGLLFQGKFTIPSSPVTVIPLCPSSYTTVFEGDVDTTTDFMTLLEGLESGVFCPYQLSANMEPYSGSYHTNIAFECDSSTLEVMADATMDSYQIECTQVTGDLTQAMRANLTIERDSSGAISSSTLGVNMDMVTDHTYINTVLDPDTLTITKLSSSSY